MTRLDAQTYHLLYEDDAGNVIGLDEVQLSRDALANRLGKLRDLLSTPVEPSESYQAALVLAAWGQSEGMTYLQNLVKTWLTTDSVRPSLSENRLYGYDDVPDEVAYAAYLFHLKGRASKDAYSLWEGLLQLYGVVEFHSKLKFVLMEIEENGLGADVRSAMERAIHKQKYYLASQLLPVLARWQPDGDLIHLEIFLNTKDDPSPRINVAEALRYIRGDNWAELLRELQDDQDPVVAREARRAVEARAGRGDS